MRLPIQTLAFVFLVICLNQTGISQPLKITSQQCYEESWGTIGLSVNDLQNGLMLGYSGGSSTTGYPIVNSRTDTAGNQIWKKLHGAAMAYNSFTAMKPWYNGKYVVAGRYQKPDYTYSTEVFLIDTLGNTLWNFLNTNPGMLETPNDIAVMADSGFLCVGLHQVEPPATGPNQITLLKISKQGKKVWQQDIGGDGFPSVGSVIALPDNGAMICGFTNHAPGPVNCNGYGGSDAVLLRVDSAGNILWQQCYGGSGEDAFSRLIPTDDHGFLAAGYSVSNDGMATGNHGGWDFWIVKTDSAGQVKWSQQYGGSGNETPFCLRECLYGGYLIGGSSGSFDGQVTGNHSDPGSSDGWLIHISEEGNLLWQQCFGGSANEALYDFAEVTGGKYFLFSETSSGETGNVTCTGQKLKSWLILASDTTKTGTPEIGTEHPVRVYPNPAYGILHFEKNNDQLLQNLDVTIYNLSVVEILRTDFPAGQKVLSITVPPVETGLFFYKITGRSTISRGKIIFND